MGTASTATPWARRDTRKWERRVRGLPGGLSISNAHSNMGRTMLLVGRRIMRANMKRLPVILLCAAAIFAQPAIKPIPAPGIEVPAAERNELQAGLAHLRISIDKLKPGPLVADVLIFHEAVRYALQYNEFF